jgi:hypothetical protein
VGIQGCLLSNSPKPKKYQKAKKQQNFCWIDFKPALTAQGTSSRITKLHGADKLDSLEDTALRSAAP